MMVQLLHTNPHFTKRRYFSEWP